MFTYRSVAVAMYRYVVRLISLLALLTLASKKDSTFFFLLQPKQWFEKAGSHPSPSDHRDTGSLLLGNDQIYCFVLRCLNQTSDKIVAQMSEIRMPLALDHKHSELTKIFGNANVRKFSSLFVFIL